MKRLSDKRINMREIRVELEWHEIETILSVKVAKEIGFNGKYKVEFKQITEGSPEYNTGKYKAYITIIEEYENK